MIAFKRTYTVRFFYNDRRVKIWTEHGSSLAIPRKEDFMDIDGEEYQVVKIKWMTLNSVNVQVVKV